ncbi:MAG: cell division protein ZapA [Sphingomonadaceae bacterium]|nr:cell division protein ZapA [Sphingomonadaceae bacterium]
MSNVVLEIGGRKFTIACADGEEQRIGNLGRMIDNKVNAQGDNAGQNEVRMLLYAALVLADELDESQGSQPSSAPTRIPPGLSDKLDSIAGKLENLASDLEQ